MNTKQLELGRDYNVTVLNKRVTIKKNSVLADSSFSIERYVKMSITRVYKELEKLGAAAGHAMRS